MQIELFKHQDKFVFCPNRFVGAFSGKRGGKTESGAIKGLLLQESKPRWKQTGIDPYTGVIIAPTTQMLSDLSWAKFMGYAKEKFVVHSTVNPHKAIWHDGSIVKGYSADRPQRIEGGKWNWAWIDEVFQVTEFAFLETMARLSDNEGYLFVTGSLGVNIINPKIHWCYKYFKEVSNVC